MYKATLQATDIEYAYLFDAKTDKLRYFALKEKYGYTLTAKERETLQSEMAEQIKSYQQYDTVVIPQSRGTFLVELAALIAPCVVIAQKASIEEIKTGLEKQAFMKSEKAKLFQVLNGMEHFVIHDIAGNQRKRFTNILFKSLDYDFSNNERVLLLDDSVFSGYTLQALQHQLKLALDNSNACYNKSDNLDNATSFQATFDSIVLFSQQA